MVLLAERFVDDRKKRIDTSDTELSFTFIRLTYSLMFDSRIFHDCGETKKSCVPKVQVFESAIKCYTF